MMEFWYEWFDGLSAFSPSPTMFVIANILKIVETIYFCCQVLMQIADDFIESVVTASCKIAKHRKSSSLDVKDVQLHLGL